MRFIAILFAGYVLAASGAQAEDAKGWFGAEVANVTGQDAGKLGWSTPHGAKVVTVEPGSPAAKAGLKPGDVISAVDKTFLDNVADFNAAIRSKQPGTGVKLRFFRGRLPSGAKEMTVAVTLEAQFSAKAEETAPVPMLDTGGHTGRIIATAVSPDGKQLVTASQDKTIRVWDIETHKTVRFIRGMAGPGIEGQFLSLALSPDGRWLAAGGWFGKDSTLERCCGDIRLYEFPTGKLIALLKGHESRALSLNFSRDGKRLISGSRDKTAIIWDMASRRPIVRLTGHTEAIESADFSADGTRAITGSGRKLILWDIVTGQIISTMERNSSNVAKMWGLTGRKDSENHFWVNYAGIGAAVKSVVFSADSGTIAWGNRDVSPQYKWQLPQGLSQLRPPLAVTYSLTEDWRSVIVRKGPLSLSGQGVLKIAKEGKVLGRIDRRAANLGYRHTSYSFTPGGEAVVSGGPTGVLSSYTLAGEVICNFIGHEGDINMVAPSPNGLFLVSGSIDQTVKLWNIKTCELLVTLFRGRNGEWVMWTPQGYYAASGPGAEMIGWQINHGPEHEADYVTAAQLRRTLNRPDIVAKAIQLASAKEAVRQSPGTDFKLSDLLKKPVPRFRIVSPAANATLIGGSTQLELEFEATPDPVKAIRIQVNGRQIAEHLPQQGGGFAPGMLQFPVSLTKGRNVIRVVAVNNTGETSHDVTVMHKGDGALNRRGTLYILAIGVDKYPNIPGNDLRVAGADAKIFADTMEARLSPQHEHVIKRVLINGGTPADVPTVVNIVDALGELRNAKPNDTILMFVSGHGITEGLNYNFLTTEAALSGNALRASTVVPWARFQLSLEAAKGRRILFLDTCRSGNSYNQRLTNDAYQANIVVYAASRWDQDAMERYDINHGLFTYAIVEGMKGAAKNKAGEIRAESLRDYVRERVIEMAHEMSHVQEPQYFRGRDAGNYLLVGAQ